MQFIKKLFYLLFFIFSLQHNGIAQSVEDQFITVDGINISGNKRTHSSIIIRELGFVINDALKLDELEGKLLRAKNNVINLNLFNDVKFEQDITNDRLTLNITVKEQLFILAIPEVLLADRSLNEWWYDRDRDLKRISYGVNAVHFNLTGNNDRLKIRALTGFVPYLELGYRRPYIDKRKRIGISASIFYSINRTMAFRTWNDKLDFLRSEDRNRKRFGGIFELRLRNALYHFHSVKLGYTKQSISDTIVTLNPNFLQNGSTEKGIFNFSYEYKYDLRNNRQYPTKGSILALELSNFIYDGMQSSLSAIYYRFSELPKKLYLENSIRAKISSPKNQMYVLTKGMGYENTLVRGFELFVIDGQHTFLQKNTLKVLALDKKINLSRVHNFRQFKEFPLKLYPNIYLDWGYTKNYFPERSNTKLGNTLLKGAGLGLDFVMWYNTNFRTYFSRNSTGQNGFFFSFGREI